MPDIIPPILTGAYLIIIAFFALILALSVYIYVRYGRTPSITITSSVMVIVFFLIAVLTAYASLNNLIALYA